MPILSLLASPAPTTVWRPLIYPDASGATRNRQVVKLMRAAINYAAELGWCNRITVKPFPENAAEKVPADLAWVEAFVAQAASEGLHHLAGLCLLMFGTGARVGEATALTWANVDLSAMKAIINQTKTDSTRTAHLPAPLVAAMANIGGNRNPDVLVFQYAGRGSVTKVWNNVAERAEIAPLTPHCCRHGFATTMMHNGIDVKTIAKLVGWKSARVVLDTYAHALEDVTITDALFRTKSAQAETEESTTTGNQKRKRQ